MEEILDNVCGLDVHKKVIVATIMCSNHKSQTQTFGATTKELLELSNWLISHKISDVAMESTGPYWKPVYNILEDDFNIILANARHIKNVPGRKTDVKDSKWICKLLKHGLIEKSLVQPKYYRGLKDLSRFRRKLVEHKTAEKNRIQKVLEDGNIKLSNVLSDIFGKTGMAILNHILDSKNEFPILHKKIKSSKEDILHSINGNITQSHKILIQISLKHMKFLEKEILNIEKEMDRILKPHLKEIELLTTIPGVSLVAAKDIISAIGVNMDVFPSEKHLSSWAGICPGNYESAGKRYSGRIGKGDKNLKAILTESAWAAIRTKKTYFAVKFKQLAKRRGYKRALVAIAHKILISVYHILKNKEQFKELGENYFLERKREGLKESYLKRLTELGFEVQVSPRAQ